MKIKEDERVAKLAKEIDHSSKLLVALGDESRQHIILTMMSMGDCSGARAVDIADRTRLSRPAVSHHLQIFKDAGILKTRKEATKIYYYFDPDDSFDASMNTLRSKGYRILETQSVRVDDARSADVE